MTVIVVGSMNVDTTFQVERLPVRGETVIAAASFVAAGGKGANQAAAAARLGADTAMIGMVGDDHNGAYLVRELEKSGCDCAMVGRSRSPTGFAHVMIAKDGSNTIVVASGANGDLVEAVIEERRDQIAQATVLLLQLESPVSAVLRAARIAKAAGACVILDPAPASMALPDELLRNVDMLTPNEIEAGQIAFGEDRSHGAPSLHAVGERLLRRGPRIVIIKRGEKGCAVFANGTVEFLAAPDVVAVDTTGAGDTFNGALAAALSERRDLDAACQFALTAASLSVTRLGAQSSMPARAAVDQRLALAGQA